MWRRRNAQNGQVTNSAEESDWWTGQTKGHQSSFSFRLFFRFCCYRSSGSTRFHSIHHHIQFNEVDRSSGSSLRFSISSGFLPIFYGKEMFHGKLVNRVREEHKKRFSQIKRDTTGESAETDGTYLTDMLSIIELYLFGVKVSDTTPQ